jgi:hypothetical protein
VALGPPLGHPRATQGPPKRHASVDLDKCFVCNRNGKKAGWGGKNKNLPLINTDDTDQKEPNPLENSAEGGGATRAIPGVESCKSLFFGVDPGEGYPARIPPCKNQRSPIPSRLLRAKSLF